MNVAFITRSTLYTVPGGDTVQVEQTARHLQDINVNANIVLSHQKVDYNKFDLIHFFNLTRPADIMYHSKKSKKPYVITPILVDYTEYDRHHRQGVSGWILRKSPSPEYTKTISRWLFLQDKIRAKKYFWKGHRKAITEVLEKARMLLPNSMKEFNQLQTTHPNSRPYSVIPNGIDEKLFYNDSSVQKDETLVVCAARIEGIKNQLALIKALNNTSFTLVLAGQASPNHHDYYKECRRVAKSNIVFAGQLNQHQLAKLLRKAKVHVLPSWFETCGLSSLEAAASGCNIVVTEKGFTRDYFRSQAFYCTPDREESIYNAVSKAANSEPSAGLVRRIASDFTWTQTAKKTREAYNNCLND